VTVKIFLVHSIEVECSNNYTTADGQIDESDFLIKLQNFLFLSFCGILFLFQKPNHSASKVVGRAYLFPSHFLLLAICFWAKFFIRLQNLGSMEQPIFMYNKNKL